MGVIYPYTYSNWAYYKTTPVSPPITERRIAVPPLKSYRHPKLQRWGADEDASGITLTPKKLFSYLGPTSTLALFTAGVATALAGGWFIKGFRSFVKAKPVQWSSPKNDPMNDLVKNSTKQADQIGIYYLQGLASVLAFAIKEPGIIRQRVKGYIGAMAMGYVGGSVGQGLQEVWVRKEETGIRAQLLQKLTTSFRKSIQIKTEQDQALLQRAKGRIINLLQKYNVANPEALVHGAPDLEVSNTYRYVSEPKHFDKPMAAAFKARFGNGTEEVLSSKEPEPMSAIDPAGGGKLNTMKGLVYGAGIACGSLGSMLFHLMAHGGDASGVQRNLSPNASKSLHRVFNITNEEAMFLTGNKYLLMSVLGLTAAAKVGKMLVDGYREVETTRKHARTELRYQSYNMLELDTAYRGIAIEEGLNAALKMFEDRLKWNNKDRKGISDSIQTILTNAANGNWGMPRYVSSTPYVQLVNARS